MSKYPILPHIAYGLIDEGGFFMSLPFRGISLNEYRKMHHGAIKKLRGQYKSIIDLILIASIKKNYVHSTITENGIKLIKSIFIDKIDVEWVLTWNNSNIHDTSNYTQKIFLDAVVDSGLIIDDSEKYVASDSIKFGTADYDSIVCILKGEINKQMFLKSVLSIPYNELIECTHNGDLI